MLQGAAAGKFIFRYSSTFGRTVLTQRVHRMTTEEFLDRICVRFDSGVSGASDYVLALRLLLYLKEKGNMR